MLILFCTTINPNDGIYSNMRIGYRLCILLIIAVTEHGNKELVAVGDGALVFWRALAGYGPSTMLGTQDCERTGSAAQISASLILGCSTYNLDARDKKGVIWHHSYLGAF